MAEAKGKTDRNSDAGQKDKEEGKAKKKGYNFNKGNRVASKKFEGKCEDLNGAIFDCAESKMADTFVKTMKELSAYCGRTFKYGGDIRISIDTLETPTFFLPDDLPPTATAGQMKLWGDAVTLVGKQMAGYNENIKKLYALVWGQCTDMMQQKLESSTGWDEIWRNGDRRKETKAPKRSLKRALSSGGTAIDSNRIACRCDGRKYLGGRSGKHVPS